MLESFANGIDKFSTKTGEITSLLVFPLLFVVIYEVFMRYALNAPTIWGFEMTAFLYGMHYMFGLAYTDVQKGHVRVDIFTSRLTPKSQAIVNIITLLVMFIPVFICLVIWTSTFAYSSAVEVERNSTSWAPVIFPYKIIMALTLFFTLLQGLSNLAREILTLIRVTKNEEV